MTKRKYVVAVSGDWVRPKRRGYKMACCDCGLVHTLNFRVVDGHIEFQPFLDNRATAAKRREKRKKGPP